MHFNVDVANSKFINMRFKEFAKFDAIANGKLRIPPSRCDAVIAKHITSEMQSGLKKKGCI